MPYITKDRREALADGVVPQNAGELNYALTRVVDQYMRAHPPPKSYARIAEVVSALECAKLEFYRRVAAPYEDVKIKTNGDVYT